MKINKIISGLLLLEVIYGLYQILPQFFTTFDSSRIILYFIVFSPIIFLLIGAIGLFFNKKWSVIILWISVILPAIIEIILPFYKAIGGYFLFIINIIIVIHLTVTNFRKSK